MERLSFDHLLQLNDKLLVNLFAELTANEMSRNYEFKCMLMPEHCQVVHTSYGNELRGRSLMLAHLKQHLAKLKKESDGSSFLVATNFDYMNCFFYFLSQPIPTLIL
jgi:hypothetical protein